MQVLKEYEVFEVDFKDVFEYIKNMLSVSWLNAKEMDYIQEVHFEYINKFFY